MASLGKDSSDSSLPSSSAREEDVVPDVIITRSLRDRELLRKRKAEAMEKDSAQWVLRAHKNQQQKRGRRAQRGRSHQLEVKAILDPEPTTEAQPDLKEEAQPPDSESALPEPACQEQLPVQNPVSGMQPIAVEGEPAVRSVDPAGEEEVLKPVEAQILEDFNSSLESDHQDNEFNMNV